MACNSGSTTEGERMNCSVLDELLLDGSQSAMERASEHAEHCATCAETLVAWNEIGSVARELRVSWESDLLLPRIQRQIQPRRSSRVRQLTKIAAILLLTAGIAATAMHALRTQTRDAAYDEALLRVAALDEVEQAERAYTKAIKRMEVIAGTKLENPETPLMVSYKEKLMLLDDAIAECEANIEQNRQNAHLRNQLLAMYSEKQQTLREVLREESDAQIR